MLNLDFYKNIKEELADGPTQLVAVSKTKPAAAIQALYEQGQRIFGENKVQELVDKAALLPQDIQWHLIGHLQRNKVKYIAPFVSLIHAVDSLRLLKEINKEAKKNNRIISCLLQFHIAQEDSKFGLDLAEAKALLQSEDYAQMQHIKIVGLMGMASFTDNQEQVLAEFGQLANYFQELKAAFFAQNDDFKELSMGMSGDYQLALQEGSTLVRIGSALFGHR
ncbi:YggS family pyridoxal phosphate-dependent enzyme [Saprospira sp. CCB-QB6]|uniref:YggS family pyridoxal phosphate-dependent enzyme n=1 Tax=Saprospira sp. CCB-QB6 TaxID=3023936 RepID=UPI00234ACBA6|nr:YggS family pyridoxal phosphate-dependent enzyme [Saprospira sp. CCB-QB6]WCL80838.1 YggS family pyridoxal phosphate-dependent enzyme [Saprospira sp. CCB-QB6]